MHSISKIFAIEVVERLHGPDEDNGYYHCFVALTSKDPTAEGQSSYAQKLHFNDDIFARMMPELRVGKGFQAYDDIRFPYLAGEEIAILPRWNKAMEMALGIKNSGFVAFDSRYTNCRTGVKDAIKTMGLDFFGEFTKSAVGNDSSTGMALEPFELDQSNPLHTDLAAMRAHNQKLIRQLI